ncbi:MAG TPA: hypothetical protein VD886_20960 [Herpetosiphonaceae bacterium]|nr:hypothetical protein [Herpetosiphonaceae bacterium]
MYTVPPSPKPQRSWWPILRVAVMMGLLVIGISILVGRYWEGVILGTGIFLMTIVVMIAMRQQR